MLGCGNNKQCRVTLFVSIWNVHISLFIFLTPYHHHEKSISAEKRSSVVSLLSGEYSDCQIQAKTGLGKGTVGKEMEGDKENHPGGRPSNLSPCDK